jgi:MFS family permease
MLIVQNSKHSEKLNSQKIFIVNIISMLMSFVGGLSLYITSSYFKDILHSVNIGWTFLIANILLIFALLNIHKIVKKTGAELLFNFLLIIKISIFITLTLTTNDIANIILMILYIISEALSWTVLKMILESNSIDKKTGQIFGFNLTLINIGLLLSPILATQTLNAFGFTGIFYLSILINLFIFFISFFNLKQKQPINTNPRHNYKNLFIKFKQRPNIQKIYLISFALEFFFATMVIYTPLYLLQNNFSWQQIGLIFTIMLIPLILIPYPIGLLTDKKIDERKLLFSSFIILSFSSFFLIFYNNSTFFSVMTILFISRIGAALISILRLSYFYKCIDKHDTDLIALFRTSRPLAFIFAPFCASFLLLFFPIQSIFILLIIISLLALYPTSKLGSC